MGLGQERGETWKREVRRRGRTHWTKGHQRPLRRARRPRQVHLQAWLVLLGMEPWAQLQIAGAAIRGAAEKKGREGLPSSPRPSYAVRPRIQMWRCTQTGRQRLSARRWNRIQRSRREACSGHPSRSFTCYHSHGWLRAASGSGRRWVRSAARLAASPRLVALQAQPPPRQRSLQLFFLACCRATLYSSDLGLWARRFLLVSAIRLL